MNDIIESRASDSAEERIPATVREEILRRLAAIEQEEEVRVLLAVESGSRAWGFASRDSDFDVRFIYVHRPEWYLSIEERRRDVIERPIVDEIDLSGWDIRKALRLLQRSNPPLLEWLDSPIVYRELPAADGIRALAPECYAPRAALHHYRSMAWRTWSSLLTGETVRRKKYFYALRPLLAVLWIERGLGAPPMEFATLMEAILPPGDLRAAIDALLAAKRRGDELDGAPRVPELDTFIADELAHLDRTLVDLPPHRCETHVLDEFFRGLLSAM